VLDVSCPAACAEGGVMAVAVGADGGVLGERAGATVLAASDGLAALAGDGWVAAAATGDLAEDKWRLEAQGRTPVLLDGAGAFWVWTGAGFVQAANGEAVGFGQDAADAAVGYQLLADGAVIRTEGGGSSAISLTRVDPATGESVWDESYQFAAQPSVRLAGGWLFVWGDGEVKCLDPKTGRARWSRPADWFLGAVGGSVLVGSDDGKVSALTDKGGLQYQFEIEAGAGAEFRLGSKTLYVLTPTHLRAYELREDAPMSWELELPEASHRLYRAGDGLWLSSEGALRPVV
jgi:outer membrane protein assembly factor BamB